MVARTAFKDEVGAHLQDLVDEGRLESVRAEISEHPKAGDTIEYYSILGSGEHSYVQHYRAVYYEHAAYREVVPSDTTRADVGAPLNGPSFGR